MWAEDHQQQADMQIRFNQPSLEDAVSSFPMSCTKQRRRTQRKTYSEININHLGKMDSTNMHPFQRDGAYWNLSFCQAVFKGVILSSSHSYWTRRAEGRWETCVGWAGGWWPVRWVQWLFVDAFRIQIVCWVTDRCSELAGHPRELVLWVLYSELFGYCCV